MYTNIFVNPVKLNDLADPYTQDEPFFILRDSGGIFVFPPNDKEKKKIKKNGYTWIRITVRQAVGQQESVLDHRSPRVVNFTRAIYVYTLYLI